MEEETIHPNVVKYPQVDAETHEELKNQITVASRDRRKDN